MRRRYVLRSAVVGFLALVAAGCSVPPPPACVDTTRAGPAGAAGAAEGTGLAARFRHPLGVTVDGSGTVYVADFGNHTIRKVTPAGVVTTVVGSAAAPGSGVGTGSEARFLLPAAVALDGSVNL